MTFSAVTLFVNIVVLYTLCLTCCGNVVLPSCDIDTVCKFDMKLSHRYTMVEYSGDPSTDVYDFHPLVALEDGRLYRKECDGSVDPIPLTDEGRLQT